MKLRGIRGEYSLMFPAIKAGGEGEIFDLIGNPKLVAKKFKPDKVSTDKENKLMTMINNPPDTSVQDQIAWPQDVLYDGWQFVGFTMRKLAFEVDLNVVYEYGSTSKYPNMSWENRIIIAGNLCAVLYSVHLAGHVCGDFNPKNISVDTSNGQIVLLDTDSFHIFNGKYRCSVGRQEYLPAEVQVKMLGGSDLATAQLPTFTKESDNFALAIHIFQLLMNGVHPFSCSVVPKVSIVKPEPSDNIIKGKFPFMQKQPGIKIPPYAPPFDSLPPYLQELFKRAFIDGHNDPCQRPAPEEWHSALQRLRNRLASCSIIPHHQYYDALTTCPFCEADERYNKVVGNVVSQSGAGLVQTSIVRPPVRVAPTSYQPYTTRPITTSQTNAGSDGSGLIAKVFLIAFLLFLGFQGLTACIRWINNATSSELVDDANGTANEPVLPQREGTLNVPLAFNNQVSIPLISPTEISGTIYRSGQVDEHVFEPEIDGVYRFIVQGLLSGTVAVNLIDSDGFVHASRNLRNDEGITLSLSAGISYTIQVAHTTTWPATVMGPYILQVWYQKPTSNVSGYTQVNDSIQFLGQINSYVFTPDNSGNHRFAMSGLISGAVTVTIIDPAGFQLTNQAMRNDEGVTVSLVAGEQYEIIVAYRTTWPASVLSPYVLAIWHQKPTIDISAYISVRDSIQFVGQVNEYVFIADESGRHQFVISDMIGGSVTVTVYDYAGFQLSSQGLRNEGSLNATLVAGQQYKIQVRHMTGWDATVLGMYTMGIYAR